METPIAQAKVQFDEILSYVQGEAQNQQLNGIEKDIPFFINRIEDTFMGKHNRDSDVQIMHRCLPIL